MDLLKQLTIPGLPMPEVHDRDTWATPWDWYHRINNGWGTTPTVDVCASEINHKCGVFITEQMDALSIDWGEFAREHGVPLAFWMNPPYSQPLMTQFIEQSINAMVKHLGAATTHLLPDWTDREWYHFYIRPFEHEFTLGRIPFLPPPGIEPSTPRYGNVHGVISEATKRRIIWPVKR